MMSAESPQKKRQALSQLTQDHVDSDEEAGDGGNWDRADEATISTRRYVTDIEDNTLLVRVRAQPL